MCKKLIYLICFAMLLSIASIVQAESFSIGASGDIEIGNDGSLGPGSSSNGSGFGMRDISTRRRVSLLSYDISGLKGGGKLFTNVSFSHFSHDQDDEVSVYGVIEDLDLLNVEALTWNTAPGVQNSPTPPSDSPVALDYADLTDVLMTFTPPSAVGVRFSTATSQALADFLNSDTDGIITFLFTASVEDTQAILRSSEHSSGGSLLEGDLVLSPELAYNPNPADNEPDVPYKVVLSWTPGEYVAGPPKHRIYFSEDFNDVNDGNDVAKLAEQDPNYYPTSGTLDLDFGQTYYWRVDEANATTTWDIGRVWQFTTEPYSYPIPSDRIINTNASSEFNTDTLAENTVNGSGLNANDEHSTEYTDMWLTVSGGGGGAGNPSPSGSTGPAWIAYEFDKVYKLHEMWIWNENETRYTNQGLQNVTIEYSTNGTDWTELGEYVFAEATGEDDYVHNTEVDFGGASAKYVVVTAAETNGNYGSPYYGLSEVRFFYIPMRARYPDPDDEDTDVPINVTLKWRAGRGAAQHDIYISENEQAVINETIDPCSISAAGSYGSYGPLSLDLGSTYYWKVNEVNMAETPSTWEGDTWQFSTLDYLVVDDMEDYGDDANTPGEPGGRIYYVWRDGWAIGPPDPVTLPSNKTGSQIYHWYGDGTGLMESTIVRSGVSMPFYYENDGYTASKPTGYPDNDDNPLKYYSEASASTSDLQIGSDWTVGNAKALVLWFYGDPNNDANATEQMYVALEDGDSTAVVEYDGDMNDVKKAEWQEWNIPLSSFTNIDPDNIQKLYIGFGNREEPASGGKGIVYFDDIRLYPYRCILSKRSGDFAMVDYAPDGDPRGDCTVNYQELEIMINDWLVEIAEEDPGADEIWREAESADTISAPLQVWSDRVDASGGQYIAVVPGNVSGDNPPAEGVATYDFTVEGGTYKILGRIIAPTGTDDSFWFNIPDANTNTNNHESGWVKWDMREGSNWHWDEVNSDDDGDATVQFTMTAGTHTLYVAYREDGALLDRLLITDNLNLNQESLPPLVTDLDMDNKTDFEDFAMLAEHWLEEQFWP